MCLSLSLSLFSFDGTINFNCKSVASLPIKLIKIDELNKQEKSVL